MSVLDFGGFKGVKEYGLSVCSHDIAPWKLHMFENLPS